jgi:hypothetical protein
MALNLPRIFGQVGGDALSDAASTNTDDGTTTTSEPKSFSSASPWVHQGYVNWLGQSTQGFVSTTTLNDFINGWAQRWKNQKGAWPGDTDLFESPGFIGAVNDLVITSNVDMPPVFQTNGTVYRRTILDGLRVIPDPSPSQQFVEQEQGPTVTIRGVEVDATSPLLPAIRAGQVPPEAAPPKMIAGDTFGGSVARVATQEFRQKYGAVPEFDLNAAVQQAFTQTGGGGGGGTTRSVTFDRDKLIEQATDYWHSLLLDHPDDTTISSVVDSYIKDATAFYVNQGGQRDFQTFLLGRIREQPRYNLIYKWKPDEVGESDFIQAFASPIANLGLSPGRTTEAVAAGAASGSSPVGAQRQVTMGRLFSQRPGFSQQLASTIQSLGRGVVR